MNRRTFLTQLGWSAWVSGTSGVIEPFPRTGRPAPKLSCAAYSFRQFLTTKPPQMTLEDFIERCAEWGLDGVELTSYYFVSREPSYLHGLKRKAFLLGLDISGTSVGNHFCLPPGEERERQIRMVKEGIDAAVELGAPCLRVFAGSLPQGRSEEEGRRWVIECLEEVCPYAEERGVFLALENHGSLTATAEQVLAILKPISSPWLGLNLDTGNFRTPNPYADIEQVAPYAITVHVKTEIAPQGRGRQEADFPRIVDILRKAGYRGYLALEYEAAEDPRVAVPRVVQRLREVIAGVRG